MLLTVVDHVKEVFAWYGVVADNYPFTGLATCSIDCHDAIVLQLSEVVDKGQRASCGYDDLYPTLPHHLYGREYCLCYGMGVEAYKCSVDVEEYGPDG